MIDDRRNTVIRVGWLLALCLLSTQVYPLAGSQTSAAEPGTAAATESFATLVGQMAEVFTSLRSIHLEASALITIERASAVGEPPEPVIGSGTFEYWAEGDKFRIRSTTDDRLGLASDREVAWDGRTFYDLALQDELLRTKSAVEEQTDVRTALPNPLFLPLDFLFEHAERSSCHVCELRLNQLRRPAFWQSRRPELLSRAQTVFEPGAAAVVVPGGSHQQRGVERKVRVAARGEAVRCLQIARTFEDGSDLMTIELGAHETVRGPGVVAEFPRHLDVSVFDPDSGRRLVHMQFVIDELELNHPIPDSVFSISPDRARTVWDEDLARFEKKPEPGR